jgi:hypothetical protein
VLGLKLCTFYTTLLHMLPLRFHLVEEWAG